MGVVIESIEQQQLQLITDFGIPFLSFAMAQLMPLSLAVSVMIISVACCF
jgi:hypothetical protein